MIDLRCCDVRDLLAYAVLIEPELIVCDAPWRYSQAFGESVVADHYETMTARDVAILIAPLAQHLDACRLALWITNPILCAEWEMRCGAWGRPRTQLTWFKSDGKSGHYGQGYHAAGASEQVLIYSVGSPPNTRTKLRSGYVEPPTEHSAKPVEWQREWIRRWTSPGGLVFDPFCGTGSVALACAAEGRRYLGAEKDPKRWATAMRALR